MEKKLRAYVTNLGKYNEGQLIGEWVSFPVKREEYQKVLERIGIGQEYKKTFITDYESGIYGLVDNLGEYEDIESLNYLAGKLEGLTSEEYEKFNAIMESAIDLREGNGIQSLVNLTENLDCYEVLPDVTDDASYGWYIIKNQLQRYNLPMVNGVNLTEYLDAEQIGRDAAINELGMYSDKGYVFDNQSNYHQIWNGKTEDIPDKYRLSDSGSADASVQQQATELMEQAEHMRIMKSISR